MSFSVDSVFVWVNDLDRAVEWYQDFGISPGPRHGAWQTMELEGTTTFALHGGERPPSGSTGAIAFRVTDLNQELLRLRKLGIEPLEDITDTGAARFARFRDPDGNDVQLLER